MSAAVEHAGGSLAALAAHLGPRTRRAAAWAAVATSVWRAAARGVAEWDHRRSWRVSVEDGDALYELALAWVAAQLPPGRRRALIAATERVGEITPGSPDGRSGLAVRFLHDPLARPVTVSVDGHAVRVSAEREEPVTGSQSSRRVHTLRFQARTAAAHDAVRALLARLAAERRLQEGPDVFILTSWGEWMRHPAAGRGRPLATVALTDGQLERIAAAVERFLGSEADYHRLGVLWHFGLLLHGPPGTGKSSTALALATHFGLPVHVLTLASVEDDGALMRLATRVPPRSMLLIEDVDLIGSSHDRAEHGDGRPGVTLAGLLNVLDGVTTPHGLVTVLSSNRPEVLDPALVRPGRVDLCERLGLLDVDTVNRLLGVMWPGAPRVTAVSRDASPAELVEALRATMGGSAGERWAAVQAVVG